MTGWYMLTIIGRDQAGIVARVTAVLYEMGCELGETSMLRLGGNFSMMVMTHCDSSQQQIQQQLEPVIRDLNLHLHIDAIDGHLHDHIDPNMQVSVHGADQAGIIARVTAILADNQFNILDLESDVGGTAQDPVYVMHIVGTCLKEVEQVSAALAPLHAAGIQIRVRSLDTLIG